MQGKTITTTQVIKDLRVKYSLVFAIISIITYLTLNYIAQDNKQKYLYQTTKNYTMAYNSILYQYKELSEIIYTGLLKFTKVDDKLYQLNTKTQKEKNRIRKDLYLQTMNRFNTLKNKKIVSINYILPNNKLLLKMNNPLKYNTTINEDKELVKYVLKNKKESFSYEVSNNSTGYRFAYPVIKNDTFVGIICITFSEQSITSSLMKQYGVISNFIISTKNLKENLLKNNETYQKAHVEGFIHNKFILEDIKNSLNESINELKPSQHTSFKLYSLGQKKEPSSVFIDEKGFVITIIPIYHHITKKYQGFLTILSKGNIINLINNNYFTILFLFIFLYLAVTLLFLEQKIKALLEKENIQELIKKDQQLIEQAKMAQMGEMIGNIAHQWRQPLSAISTMASGVKLNHDFGLLKSDDIPKNMDVIVENTKYLSKTIDTFRDFIKEKRVKKEIVLQEKIEESLKIVQATLENNHIELIKNIDLKNPIHLTMIPEELSQVLINIINNAKDAICQNHPKEGWIKVSMYTTNEHIYIYIEDNAGGIEKDVLEKIFDPYFTTKHQSQGTGLGLYMSKIIVEKHLDGILEVSNSTNGALFTIRLNKN